MDADAFAGKETIQMMMNIRFNRRSKAKDTRDLALVRTFVRTGDARCPLAAVWKLAAAPATAAQKDEPSIPWPAMERLRLCLLAQAASLRVLWRPFLPSVICIEYSAS